MSTDSANNVSTTGDSILFSAEAIIDTIVMVSDSSREGKTSKCLTSAAPLENSFPRIVFLKGDSCSLPSQLSCSTTGTSLTHSHSVPIRLAAADIHTCIDPAHCSCRLLSSFQCPSIAQLPNCLSCQSTSITPFHRGYETGQYFKDVTCFVDHGISPFPFLKGESKYDSLDCERRRSEPCSQSEKHHVIDHETPSMISSDSSFHFYPSNKSRRRSDGINYVEVTVVPHPIMYPLESPRGQSTGNSKILCNSRTEHQKKRYKESPNTLGFVLSPSSFVPPLCPQSSFFSFSKLVGNTNQRVNRYDASSLQEPLSVTYQSVREDGNDAVVKVIESVDPSLNFSSSKSKADLTCRPRHVKRSVQLSDPFNHPGITSSTYLAENSCNSCLYCDDTCSDASCRRCIHKKQKLRQKASTCIGARWSAQLSKAGAAALSGEMCEIVTRKRQYTLCQVRRHNNANDCWVTAHGIVYDATSFLLKHPAGDECILRKAGSDVTQDFDYHSPSSHKIWRRLAVGIVIPCRGCPGSDKLAYGKLNLFIDQIKSCIIT